MPFPVFSHNFFHDPHATWLLNRDKETNRRPAKGSLMAKIKPKARVIYFPLVLRHQPPVEHSCDDGGVLRIAWPHRWEHDKNPDSFFECLLRLKSEGFRFRVAVLGESYNEKPPVFEEFRYEFLSILPTNYRLFPNEIGLESTVIPVMSID